MENGRKGPEVEDAMLSLKLSVAVQVCAGIAR